MTKQSTIDFGFEDIPVSEKQAKVRGVFDSVAAKYDIMNDAMSMGVHRLWKDMTINKVNPQPGELHIDVAGGTGDLARRFIKRLRKRAYVEAARPPELLLPISMPKCCWRVLTRKKTRAWISPVCAVMLRPCHLRITLLMLSPSPLVFAMLQTACKRFGTWAGF